MTESSPEVILTVDTKLGADKLSLWRLRGEEMISGLFHYHLEMVSDDDKLDFTKIVDTTATVHIAFEGGTERWVNGIVSRFVQGGTDGEITTYYAELRPKLWLTTLSSDCRIFQELKVDEIIDKLLDELGFTVGTDYRWNLKGSYEKREYCVQYRETAFNFVCRLLEDEGIFFFFEHENGKHKAVFADDADHHPALPGVPALRVRRGAVGSGSEVGLLQCSIEEVVVPKQYAMNDYDFSKPSTSLLVKAEGKTGTGALYEVAGGYLVTKAGEARASRRLEAHESSRRLLSGLTYCRALVAGFKVALTEHYREDFNTDYVIHWLSLEADSRTFSNSLRAFPKSVPFRPALQTPRPRTTGSETALVVGAKGEEIFADAKGRVKVQFHWDRLGKKDENSSCWIRVSQPWAGTGWGSLFLPRVGQEVVVHYLEGDPDRPLITGAVYNGEHALPYDPSKQGTTSTIKSRSSKEAVGFNEIRLEDKKDSEEIYIHAQKNMTIMVKHDRVKTVLHDEKNTIKNSRTTTVQEADDKLTVAKGNLAITVAKGNRTLAVETGNDTTTVKGNYVLKVDGNITIQAGGSITIKAGTSLLSQAGTDLTNKAGTGLTNKAGTDLKAEAGMNMSLKAGITLEGKGTMVKFAGAGMAEVKGGGMLTLKGGVVMVN